MKQFKHKDYISIGTPVNSGDYNLFSSIVNIGIDSHLEAFTNKSYFFFDCGKFHFHFHRSEKHILLRRLNDLLAKAVDNNDAEYLEQWIEDITNYDQLVKN